MGKKSMFYTFAAITLAIVIFITYQAYFKFGLYDRMEVTQTRIESVNFFIKDVESDLKKGIYISSFRSVLSLSQFIATNGTFLSNVSKNFKESFINGTLNGMELSLMTDSTFTDWANKIAIEADKIDIIFNFSVNDIKLEQSNPWYLDVWMNISLNVRDKKNTSMWNREKFLSSKLIIIDFEDPIYIVHSSGRIANPIVPSNISQFVINGDPSNLLVHNNFSYYIANDKAPSFLMRFEGSLNASQYGIESLVNVDEFIDQGLLTYDRSVVDYIYFGAQSTTDYRINNTPSWFKIDQEHLDFYGVTNITI